VKRLVRILAVLAISMSIPIIGASSAAADTNAFTITSFEADYYLARDTDGRSTLRTVETIVAQFPNFAQNHGLLRDLVDDYQGQPTNISIESITDAAGHPWPWESESSDEFLRLKIGDADRYVLGEQTFVITYTQHNVTLFDTANGVEEFYWDTNGTGWPQSFGVVTARLHVQSDLAAELNGNIGCYRGSYGSTQECQAPAQTGSDGDVIFEVSERDIAPYTTVTLAIGFNQGSFVPRDNSAWASPFFYVELVTVVLAVIVAIVALVLRFTTFADAPGRPTIVAEYLPPSNASPVVAGVVTNRKKKAVAAQMVSWAVNHKIRIIESPAEGFFAFGDQYTLELLDPTGLDDDETRLARTFFGSLTPGSQYTISRSDTAVGKAIYTQLQSLHQATDDRGWHKKVPVARRILPALAVLGASGLAFLMFILMVDDGRGDYAPFLLWLPAALAVLIVFGVIARRPLTEKGSELRDYLRGLELYISVAETDRIRMLQSPEGAERTAVDTTDRGQMLKLYERVLPYAVLFGQEKKWSKLLGEYYDQQSPDWYSGTNAFSAASFASGIGTMAATSGSAYSGSSSSSGGSSGGGSSGGGGGGGGGGGW